MNLRKPLFRQFVACEGCGGPSLFGWCLENNCSLSTEIVGNYLPGRRDEVLKYTVGKRVMVPHKERPNKHEN